MIATGRIHPESSLKNKRQDEVGHSGLEYSGVDKSGKRVMGVTIKRPLENQTIADNHFLWELPKHWTLEDGATVPVAYVTSYHALYLKGNSFLW